MKKKILVVDDEKEIVDFLERFLSRFNISVIKATGGKEAIESYRQNQPDCIFLDIQMPDKDGITVLQELKELNPAIKVIMITGKEEQEFYKKAKKYGAVDYITKPLDLEELRRKVEQYVV
ncbi:MAG: response regulator [Candidatus Omnitrophota bacterium]|nr:MAG: response regulator [Candidatus Omnitrophota bacterium]